jgi:glycosyltransferase involved in cell wall biosynthesis
VLLARHDRAAYPMDTAPPQFTAKIPLQVAAQGSNHVITNQRRVAFVTTPNTDPWSGAEELWARTALDLLANGTAVSASVTAFSPLHPRMVELQARGVDLWPRPSWYSLHKHPIRRLRSREGGPVLYEVRRMLTARPPALTVFSEGNALPPLALLEHCVARRIPFVTVMQANKDAVWYPDDIARRYRTAVAAAQRCFFVSDGNRRLSEKQLGGTYTNAEIVRNPVTVPYNVSLPWPQLGPAGELRFACVGRLYPPAKGQDLLLEALAGPQWRNRPWQLSIYGTGDMRSSLVWLANQLDIADRVAFPGFVPPEQIWAENHVLVMPSRFEGLPLAMVEAMLCGRPVVATDIAGHREIIEDGVTGFLACARTAAGVAAAMERFWQRRDQAVEIGKAAARRIREIVPANPARIFADKLQSLIEVTLRD